MLEWILKLTLAPLHNQQPYGIGISLAPASNIMLEWILENSEFLWKFRVVYSHQYQKPCWTGFLTWFTMLEWILKLTLAPYFFIRGPRQVLISSRTSS